MIKIRVCPECWQRVEPMLGRATLDEREFLLSVARKIRLCKRSTCKVEAERLQKAAETNNFDRATSKAWQWLEDTFGRE